MDRAALKARAREVIATSNPKVLTVGLVYLLIGIVLNEEECKALSVMLNTSCINQQLGYLEVDKMLKWLNVITGVAIKIKEATHETE